MIFAYAIMPIGKEKCEVHVDWLQRKNPESVSDFRGFLFLFWVRKGLIPQAGYRLFVTVQPFDDVMANYTSHNSNNKRNDIFHAVHLPSVPI